MQLNPFKLFFNKDENKEFLANSTKVIEKINALETKYSKITDTEIKDETENLRNRVLNGETLDSVLVEAFALVREATKRTLKLRAYDVQLIGAIALHKGCISEMKTGEGKTLVSVFAAYLNTLGGKNVIVLTVNDYLAKRDSNWMKPVYEMLGLSVGCVTPNMNDTERKVEYSKSITYVTGNDLVFDYLRDNMKYNIEALVLPELNFVIVDEADSILIDEARTPLTITGHANDKSQLYMFINSFVNEFEKEKDFEIDEKDRNITLTNTGIEKLESILKKQGVLKNGDLFTPENVPFYQHLLQALKAYYVFFKDKDYIIKDNQIILVDELTGRLQEGRRLGGGLHQALEAKEKIKIQQENQTVASITFQNFFKLFNKMSGMTGTAKTEEKEFFEVYNLKTISIPPNLTVIRKDLDDVIYATHPEKEEAVIAHIKSCFEKKQPVLIGTISVEQSEQLSKSLKKLKIPHNVLNAKHHDKEAQIIAEAGLPSAVTIATNMAGRGTDIQLGGNPEVEIANAISKTKDETKIPELIKEIKEKSAKNKEIVIEAGGLCIIGTERHESRRIDNQLRGRSGRQGDVGESIFYISMEDDLMRVFGSGRIQEYMKKLIKSDKEPLKHPWITNAIAKAQMQVEQRNFEYRKHILRFDTVLHDQRQVVYSERNTILNPKTDIVKMVSDIRFSSAENLIHKLLPEDKNSWDINNIQTELHRVLGVRFSAEDWKKSNKSKDEILKIVEDSSEVYLKEKIKIFGDEYENALRTISLQVIDKVWKEHLYNLDQLRNSIGLRAYAQKDPLVEYKREAFQFFNDMMDNMQEQISMYISHVEIKEKK